MTREGKARLAWPEGERAARAGERACGSTWWTSNAVVTMITVVLVVTMIVSMFLVLFFLFVTAILVQSMLCPVQATSSLYRTEVHGETRARPEYCNTASNTEARPVLTAKLYNATLQHADTISTFVVML